MKSVKLLFLIFVLSSCAVKIDVQNQNPKSNIITENDPFRIFEVTNKISLADFEVLGDFSFKDPGFAVDCNYNTILSLTISKAKRMGGNGIKIYEHKAPDAYSTCDRIKGKILFSEEMWKYEKEIIWSNQRKLMTRDFRGSADNKPYTAASYTGFTFQYIYIPVKSKVNIEVKTFFKTNESYFKEELNDSLMLKNQQIHFDTSELYSRIFIKRILEECKTFNQLEMKFQTIYNEVHAELVSKHNEIMSEAYNNKETHTKWLNEIAASLEKYKNYSRDKYTVAM